MGTLQFSWPTLLNDKRFKKVDDWYVWFYLCAFGLLNLHLSVYFCVAIVPTFDVCMFTLNQMDVKNLVGHQDEGEEPPSAWTNSTQLISCDFMYMDLSRIILGFVSKWFLHLFRNYSCIWFVIIPGFARHAIILGYATLCLIFVVHMLSIHFLFKNKCVEWEKFRLDHVQIKE